VRTWLQFTDEESCGRAAASHIGRLARRVLAERRTFRLALSGGRSPLPLFRHLADPGLFPFWEATHVFLVDERMVPRDHPDSNFGSIRTHLLDLVPIPADNVHPMNTELPAGRAARDYETLLGRQFGCAPPRFPALDLAVLGMGGDGHTASIFPAGELPQGYDWVAPVPPPAAKPAVARLTLTPAVLNAAREVLFMVLGADKHPVLQKIRSGRRDWPASRIDVRPQSWYLFPAQP